MNKITAIYVRVSTDEQAKEGYSIHSQVDRLMAYAKFQGWQNIEVFADEGRSAKDMNRPAMKRLVNLIKKKKVSTVATISVDRLSRNLLDMLQFVDLCEKHGAAYVCAALNFDTSTPIGRMVLQILAAFAEFERAMISDRVKSNMMEISEKKKKYMAVPPFGYKYDEHKNLVPVPEEAEWVKKAADMFISGHGYRAVSKYLNDNGIRTTKGKEWSSSTVRGMLTNELYIGKVIWNRRYYDTNGKMCWRDPSEWIVHENVHPSILTQHQWDEIHKRIDKKVPKGGSQQFKHRLSGFIVCGHCGAKMVSRKYGSKGPHKDKRIYVCSNYQKSGGCHFNRVFMDEADDMVYSVLEGLSDGKIKIKDEYLQKASESLEEEFKRREAAIDQKFQRQIEAYENGLIGAKDLKIARERIEKERELLELEKSRAQKPQKSEIEEFVRAESKQLLWAWNNADLPVLHKQLRLIFKDFVALNNKIVDYRYTEDLV
ncbi:MAG: site-specific recombinase [Clostridia bacterium]|nr:site-specific recombinase [Clostridia bacterium]